MKCISEWTVAKGLSIPSECPFCGVPLATIPPVLHTMREALDYIVETAGTATLHDGQKLLASFAENAPALRREYKLLESFIECNGHIQLLDALSLSEEERQQRWTSLVQYMEEERWLNRKGISLVCGSFWNAASRGKIPTPVLTQTATASSVIQIGNQDIPINVTQLDLAWCFGINDLSPLAELSQLTDLDLSGCWEITDLSPLEGLSQLSSLALSECDNLTDLEPLIALSQLSSLNLSECDQLADLAPLAALSCLTELDLSWCEGITDLSPLAGLSQLTKLDLSGCEKITDFSPLMGLSRLTKLDLSGCEAISSVEVNTLKAALPQCDIIY